MEKNLEVRDRKTTAKDKMTALHLATILGLPSAYLEIFFLDRSKDRKKKKPSPIFHFFDYKGNIRGA